MTPEEEASQRVLVEARRLIADPARWTREAYARDASGTVVVYNSARAACFCAVGALRRVAGGEDAPGYQRALARLNIVTLDRYGFAASTYNDNHEHADVLSVFDEAIAFCAEVTP